MTMISDEIYSWFKALFPMNRTLAGPDSRTTIEFLKSILSEISIRSIDSGTKVNDRGIPREWSANQAFVENSAGVRVIDFADNNLHLVGYPIPIEKILTRAELDSRLYSAPQFPDSIPYVTSYYSED